MKFSDFFDMYQVSWWVIVVLTYHQLKIQVRQNLQKGNFSSYVMFMDP